MKNYFIISFAISVPIHNHKKTAKLFNFKRIHEGRSSFAGNGERCYGGIFNSLPLTCFSWGEAGGERGAWFVSIFTQNDEHGLFEIRKERVRDTDSPSQNKIMEKMRRNRVRARACFPR